MADDDECGDLYDDVFRPPSMSSQSLPSSAGTLDSNFLFEEEDDEDEKGTIPRVSDSYAASNLTAKNSIGRKEDWMIEDADNVKEEPLDWSNEKGLTIGGASSPKKEYSPDEREKFRFSLDEMEGSILGVSRGKVEEENDAEIPGGGSDPGMEVQIDDGVEDDDQKPVIPGLSDVSPGINDSEEKISGSVDFESDSEDDLDIVLNDDSVGRPYGTLGNEDEDEEEDLVIVTDEDHLHHHLSVEEQEYGDNSAQAPVDGERNEALESSKGNGVGIGTRVGYGSHGFHGQHHSQFKYIRPGAAGPTAGPTGSSVPGQTRPPLAMGPFTSLSRGMQKGYGASAWGGNVSARIYSGLDFTLPSHKTIFDVDIDSFEEKPWKIPGVDISDFFNFGLDENKWKDYRKLLEQLRLEATMQSKIRVYESGRSEQDYDPDLPPELAAATGVQDIYSDSVHHAKADGGSFEIIGPGMGVVRTHQQLPMGRAIQVEGGYGDRLPSIDTRRPRMRDLDVVIEIVPVDSFDDSVKPNDEKHYEPEEHQSVAYDLEYSDQRKDDFNEIKREMADGKEAFRKPEGKEWQRPTSDKKSGVQEYSAVDEEDFNAKEGGNLQAGNGEIDKNGGLLEASSPSRLQEPSIDVLLEGDPNEKVALDDGDDMEYEERASDFLDTDEVPKENGLQKSSAPAEQKLAHGSSRKGKSENSAKDYPRKQAEERRSSQRRDDHGRDVGHVDRHQTASKGRLDLSQSHHGRRSEGGLEKSREKEDVNARRAKDEAASRQRDKARGIEKKGKDQISLSKKHEDLDRKKQTDRDDVKKRKDEEQRRREKDSKEHSQSVTGQRKREDQLRDGSSRHRDDISKQREKEESQRVKQPNDEGNKQKEREGKVSSGGGKGSERHSSKDRKRYPEKGTEQTEKHKHAENKAHNNQRSSKERKEKQLRSGGNIDYHRGGDTKNLKESSQKERETQKERESQKESSRKKKEIEPSERKPASGKRKRDSRSQAGSSKSTNDLQERRNSSKKGNSHVDAVPEVSNPQNTHSLPLPPLPPPPPLPFPPPANLMAENMISDEDNSQSAKRGRSKLERWTSQKERDVGGVVTPSEASGKVENGEPSDASGKEKERHLETVAKLKKRSERFKVPLPGEKEVVPSATVKKTESEVVPFVQGELPTDTDVKQERPARKRRWSSSG